MMIELVEIKAITETIEHVRDRQRAVYEQLSPKKTIARHIASTHVEFCDQLLQAIGKMERIGLEMPIRERKRPTPEEIARAFCGYEDVK